MPKSNYLAQGVLNLMRATTFTAPATMYLALFKTMPANDVQTIALTGSPTGGTFTLTLSGQTTSALAWNATAAAVQTALQAISSIGAGNCTVTGLNGQPDAALPGDTLLVTFSGTKALGNQTAAMTSTDSTTGGSHAISITHVTTGTNGVEPSAGSYARTAVTFSAPAGQGESNSGAVNFPQSTGSGYDASAMLGWGIYDASTVGNLFYYDVFAGTNDVWTLVDTFTTAPTGGTFTLSLTGTTGNEIGTTSAIPWNTDALTLQSILEEMVGAGNVSVRSAAGQASGFVMPNTTTAVGGLVITFIGTLRYQSNTLSVGTSSLTGGTGSPTATVTHTTTGASGSLLVNQANVTPSISTATLTISES